MLSKTVELLSFKLKLAFSFVLCKSILFAFLLDQCIVTRTYLFLHKFWFFSAAYYFGNWAFIAVSTLIIEITESSWIIYSIEIVVESLASPHCHLVLHTLPFYAL